MGYVKDLAFDAGDERSDGLYLSMSTGRNSSVARFDRTGAMTDVFVAAGGPATGRSFEAIIVGDEGVFAFNWDHSAVYRWTHHRRSSSSSSSSSNSSSHPGSTPTFHVADAVWSSPLSLAAGADEPRDAEQSRTRRRRRMSGGQDEMRLRS